MVEEAHISIWILRETAGRLRRAIDVLRLGLNCTAPLCFDATRFSAQSLENQSMRSWASKSVKEGGTAMTIAADVSRTSMPWWREPTKDQWKAWIAAWLGWTLDAFDFTIFLLIMLPISQEFGVPLVAVTAVFTATLWLRLLGATSAGWMADRMGRRAPLMISILWYSLCNFIAGFSPTFTFLFFFRALLGIGMGAEWPAGAALAMEAWPARSRGFMSGLLQGSWGIGYALSSACYYGLVGRTNPLYGILPYAGPTIGWREMLWIGVLPALVCVWIRFYVKEPEVWAENKRFRDEQSNAAAATAGRTGWSRLSANALSKIGRASWRERVVDTG